MASQSQLISDLNATKNALATLRAQLALARPGSTEQTQLSIAIFNLGQQEATITAQLQRLTQVTNPPNPQVVNATPVPPPPPLKIQPQEQGNPPDPTVRALPSAPPLAQIQREPNNQFIFSPDGELLPADSLPAQEIQAELQEQQERRERIAVTQANDIGGDFIAQQSPEGDWEVYDLSNPDVPVIRGLTEQEARLQAEERSLGDPGYGLPPNVVGPTPRSQAEIRAQQFTDEQSRREALLAQARAQAPISELRKLNGTATGDGDWRVRLRLAPNANYLYKTPGVGSAGILEPLRNTDGVIFPYTPKIDITYSADYNPYDLVHTNYRGYFYRGSKVGEIVVTAAFTAQDSVEADYLLAAIHFFRSCTKMFYGQDQDRGSPPPMVYLSGLGEFQFNEHPCAISQFNYNLPEDVDYIRARGRQSTSAGITQGGNGLMWRRTLASTPTASYNLSSIWARLTGANLPQGGMNIPEPPPNLGVNSPTYVPTKITMTLTLLPMPTRSQISQQFSLEKYANGNLLRGGFW